MSGGLRFRDEFPYIWGTLKSIGRVLVTLALTFFMNIAVLVIWDLAGWTDQRVWAMYACGFLVGARHWPRRPA